ncbi:MAG: hydratase [Hyphomicrobiales bacterium]|nr:hydratase [Hyphomicrobiales bacterium]
MNHAAAQAASDLLRAAWMAGGVIDELPEAVRPRTRAEGYAVQARLEQSMGPLYGWKIAATSAAGQAHINVDGPLAGRIFSTRVIPDGGIVPFAGNRMAVAEPEFAFRMGRDLPPREKPYSVDETLDAVASLHPAIEIPDSRYADFLRVGAAQLIADNACGHYFLAGAATDADWRRIDLAAHPVVGRVEGRYQREGVGANALGDPRVALTWLANELSSIGVTLRAGETVTTGVCVQPLEIVAGDVVTIDLGAIGRAQITIGS